MPGFIIDNSSQDRILQIIWIFIFKSIVRCVCLFVCLYACLYVCLYVCLSVCMYIFLRVCMYVFLHVCIVCPFVWSVCLSVCMLCRYVCMYVRISVCMYVFLSSCLSVYMSFFLTVYQECLVRVIWKGHKYSI